MNGRGGCCIARYGGGGGSSGGGGMYRGMSNVDRIMLKFRPIAPKPLASGSGSFSGGSTTENSDGYVKCRKGKRKYVRVNGNKKKKGNSKRCSDENKKVTASPSEAVVTLSLLPETPDRKEQSSVAGLLDLLSSADTTKCNCKNNKRSAPAPVWLSFNNTEKKVCYGNVGGVVDQVVAKPPPPPPPPRRLQTVSYVTVECLSNTWVDGAAGLECTNKERVMNMEMDTCPGFISDNQDRVVWTNKAFRQMVGGGHVFGGEDISVVLVRKDKWTPSPVTYPTFTCKVKVSSAITPSSPTRTVPCDVWRMERGACAWRLDVNAALSLGR